MTSTIPSIPLEKAHKTEYGNCYLLTFPNDVFPSILYLEGSDFERGKAHGFLYASKIVPAIDRYITPIYGQFGGWIPDGNTGPTLEQQNSGKLHLIQAAKDKCFSAIQDQTPSYWNELKGLHAGFQEAGLEIPFEEVALMNCFPEITSVSPQCSNFAAWDSATHDGKLIHGINLDDETFGFLDKSIGIIIHNNGKKNSLIGMHVMGNPAPNSWMNDKGMGYGEMTCNSIMTHWPQIPHLMHGRKVAEEAHNLEDADKIWKETGGTTGWANLVSHADGQVREAVVMEITGQENTVRSPDPAFPHIIWQTNTFQCYPGNRGYSGINTVKGQVDFWESRPNDHKPFFIRPDLTWADVDTLEKWQTEIRCPRFDRYEEMLTQLYGQIDVKAAIAIQSDPVLTTQQTSPRKQISPPVETLSGNWVPLFSHKVFSIYSLILVPEDLSMWVAHGSLPAQLGEYYHLDCAPFLKSN